LKFKPDLFASILSCDEIYNRARALGCTLQRSCFFGQSRFFAKALPEADLRYFSNANACFSLEKAIYVLSVHGAYFEVCVTSPALCFAMRLRRSLVTPT